MPISIMDQERMAVMMVAGGRGGGWRIGGEGGGGRWEVGTYGLRPCSDGYGDAHLRYRCRKCYEHCQ